MNILEKILDVKRKELAGIKQNLAHIEPFDTLSLKNAISVPNISIIAEIKIKSPSSGDIMPNADPVLIAKDYESAGASAISVLTDEQYFGGHIDILESVKQVVTIPVLRKDFIIKDYQIAETASIKADAFLLIAEALSDQNILDLINFGKELDMEALVEFHSEDNLEIISEISPEIIGVNCRDLKTMETDITYFGKMAKRLPVNSVKVAESGITKKDELKYISDLGYDAALVGTSLMKTGDPGKALDDLLRGVV